MEDNVNILIVDDSPSWCSIYEEALVESDYTVRIASNLSTALEYLDQQFFHVAVVDIRLDTNDRGNAEGLDVLQRIWELNEGTVAIVASGHATADMLPSFRTYGVFDFVAKEELSPGDLARQYQSAAFIKGTIDKTGSLDESLRRIQQAVQEARRVFTNKKWIQSPFHIFKGISSKDVQGRLRGSGMVELRPFLGHICRPLYPWLHSDRAAVAIGPDCDQPLAIEGYAWSRGLGKPVAVRIGRQEQFQESVRLSPIGAGWDDAVVGREIIHFSSPHFEGVACEIADRSFDPYFSPPPARRTSQ